MDLILTVSLVFAVEKIYRYFDAHEQISLFIKLCGDYSVVKFGHSWAYFLCYLRLVPWSKPPNTFLAASY